MQFMEPLGTADGSVEAMWNHETDDWYPKIVEETKKLGPTLMRYGGCLSSYYRWREGVGPRDKRKPFYNLLWRGLETNQVGTHEFVDFSRRVGAEPFYCVNFESDGRKHWAKKTKWGIRSAGQEEAAGWVDYCNNPSNRERIKNGAKEPFNLKLWQIGNETSYDPNGFDCETAAKRTAAFAKAMRNADPDLKLIGWGDNDWTPGMLEVAGEHINYISYHTGYPSKYKNPPFADWEFQKDPERTWKHLMSTWYSAEQKLKKVRAQAKPYGHPIAVTEGHLTFNGRHRGNLQAAWAAGVAYGKIFNMYQRHGDVVKILTLADFCGTRWGNNAVMVRQPGCGVYLMPVAHTMKLFRHHKGRKAVAVTGVPDGLDITASRTGKKIWLHAVNTEMKRSIKTRIKIDGLKIKSGKVFEIAADPFREVYGWNADEFEPKKNKILNDGTWTFPKASVSAVELQV